SGDPSFSEVLKRVREVALSAYAHQDVPFEKIVEELQPERSTSHSPLFQVMFVLQNTPGQNLEFEGVNLHPMGGEGRTAKFDLTLAVTEQEGALSCSIEYSADLFDEESMRRMARHYE